MDWVKTINNAIAYMENHLTDDITPADIAKSVIFPLFIFTVLFLC